MADTRKKLAGKFTSENRYSTFGHALKSIHIRGFRGVVDLNIDFQFPITAISGLNGAGKSTVGQLCLSAYKNFSGKRFYVRDFFPASAADPNPFTDDSNIIYEYHTEEPNNPQSLTVARTKKRQWSGYKRQPERSCYYIGFTIYIPKVEQRDLSIYRGAQVVLGEQRAISDVAKQYVGRILGQQYNALHFQRITHGKKEGELGIASRFGAQYSENNMGFGEGRMLYLVDLLEHSPEKSLFVIEEPETSLHESAQRELGKYLLDVCNRRNHQIILTTHSSTLLQVLPEDARLMLIRDTSGVTAFPGLSVALARSILSDGQHRDLTILVEDEFAKLLLTEIIRFMDQSLLGCVDIHPVGDQVAVRSGLKLLGQVKKRSCIAVRDADVGPDPEQDLYSFPGTQAPEQEVYKNEDVHSRLNTEFNIDVEHVLAQKGISNHHEFTATLAEKASAKADYLCTVAIKAYINSKGSEVFEPLVTAIRKKLI